MDKPSWNVRCGPENWACVCLHLGNWTRSTAGFYNDAAEQATRFVCVTFAQRFLLASGIISSYPGLVPGTLRWMWRPSKSNPVTTGRLVGLPDTLPGQPADDPP